MSFINKPKVRHPDLPQNELGLTRRDYEGAMSTLCAGCGHDSVTSAIIEAIWGLSMRPEQLVKLSGIGCSSKTTAYFASGAHGFNGVHGRMPSVATGANAANKDLYYIGVWATATRCPSASASSRTRSAATSTCCTCARTTACTA